MEAIDFSRELHMNSSQYNVSPNATSLPGDGYCLLSSYKYLAIRCRTSIAPSTSVGSLAELKRSERVSKRDTMVLYGHAW